MSKTNARFLTASTLSLARSCSWDARIFREAIAGEVVESSVVIVEDSLEALGDLGIGRDVPKLFRDPRRPFIEGETLRLCIRADASLIELLEAGTSMAPPPWGSAGMLTGPPLISWLAFLWCPFPLLETTFGVSIPKSESSKRGMIAVQGYIRGIGERGKER
jgi:hypothetical protein